VKTYFANYSLSTVSYSNKIGIQLHNHKKYLDTCMKWYILYLTKTVITFKFCFETQKNCDSCISTGRGVGKQIQWIGEKMQLLQTSMLIS